MIIKKDPIRCNYAERQRLIMEDHGLWTCGFCSQEASLLCHLLSDSNQSI